MAELKIQLRGVTKAFGSKKVLTGVDLDVAKGESVVIIGGSGTGKSVTLKCILGLLRPDAGSIKIDGREVTGLSTSERDQAPFSIPDRRLGRHVERMVVVSI